MKRIVVDRDTKRIHLRNILHNAEIMPREHYDQIKRITVNGHLITDMDHFHEINPAKPVNVIELYGITHWVQFVPTPIPT